MQQPPFMGVQNCGNMNKEGCPLCTLYQRSWPSVHQWQNCALCKPRITLCKYFACVVSSWEWFIMLSCKTRGLLQGRVSEQLERGALPQHMFWDSIELALGLQQKDWHRLTRALNFLCESPSTSYWLREYSLRVSNILCQVTGVVLEILLDMSFRE